MRYTSKPLFHVGDITLRGTIERKMRNTVNPEVWSYYVRNADGRAMWFSEPHLIEERE